jgi:hypothetical protein
MSRDGFIAFPSWVCGRGPYQTAVAGAMTTKMRRAQKSSDPGREKA